MEPDRERSHGSIRLRLHQRRDRRRVGSAGEKCTHGHVGNALQRDGTLQLDFELFCRLVVVALERLCGAPRHDFVH